MLQSREMISELKSSREVRVRENGMLKNVIVTTEIVEILNQITKEKKVYIFQKMAIKK